MLWLGGAGLGCTVSVCCRSSEGDSELLGLVVSRVLGLLMSRSESCDV